MEPTRIYRSQKEEVDDNGESWLLDRCHIVREGDDLTLIGWGAIITEALSTADALAARGISAEVIDVVTLKPYDADSILTSLGKTGRCVIIHEAARTAGFGAELAAMLAEHAMVLLAPVERVTGYDVVMPLPKLEKAYMPSRERILEACGRVMAWS